MSPMTIIRSCGTFFTILAIRARRISRRNETLPRIAEMPGMHATTMMKSKLFHRHSGPTKYRHGSAPSAPILTTHSTVKTPSTHQSSVASPRSYSSIGYVLRGAARARARGRASARARETRDVSPRATRANESGGRRPPRAPRACTPTSTPATQMQRRTKPENIEPGVVDSSTSPRHRSHRRARCGSRGSLPNTKAASSAPPSSAPGGSELIGRPPHQGVDHRWTSLLTLLIRPESSTPSRSSELIFVFSQWRLVRAMVAKSNKAKAMPDIRSFLPARLRPRPPRPRLQPPRLRPRPPRPRLRPRPPRRPRPRRLRPRRPRLADRRARGSPRRPPRPRRRRRTRPRRASRSSTRTRASRTRCRARSTSSGATP